MSASGGFLSRQKRRAQVAWALWLRECDAGGPRAAARSLASTLLRFAVSRTRVAATTPSAPASKVKSAIPNEGAAKPAEAKALFIGYAEGALGLGEAYRGDLIAARAAGVDFAVGSYVVGLEGRRLPPFMPERYDRGGAYDVVMIETAAEFVPDAIAAFPAHASTGTRRVARCYWELPRAPEAWRDKLAGFHEMWAPNAFVAQAFAPIFSGRIEIAPPTLVIPEEGAAWRSRASFGLPDDALVVLFTFDYFSYPARKNPLAALEAFRRAFPLGTERVVLAMKSVGPAHHHPEIYLPLRAAARRDRRIVVMDGSLPRLEALALIKNCDVYLSLHRSEGFGLGMAEAMWFARPVVGADFSASQEFLTRETGWPVACRLRPVEPGEYPFHEGQSWAEPDVEDAARALREIAADPRAAQIRALAGQAFVRARYDGRAGGAAIRARVAALTLEAEKDRAREPNAVSV